jgi:predicted nucleotidyltransferase
MKPERGLGIEEVLGDKREEILAIAAHHGASNMRLFDAVARGEARPGSDIDFWVEIEPGRSLLDRIGRIQNLEDLLGRKLEVAKAENLHERIRDRVLKEAILLSEMNLFRVMILKIV